MDYFTEQGLSYGECLRKIRDKYGDGYKILMQRSVRLPGGFLNLFPKEGVEISGIVSIAKPIAPPKPLNFEEEKNKIIAAAGKDPTLQKVLDEVRQIKDKLDTAAPGQEEHPTLIRIAETLGMNDFSSSYIRGILDRIRKEFSLEALEDYEEVQGKVVEWIGEGLRFYGGGTVPKRSRILTLVGPTGVGKTTTVAKLAALYGLGLDGGPSQSVRMITIDNLRIAAKQQLEKYGEIMHIPVSGANNYDELKKTIALYENDADLIVIDTFGNSPRDWEKLAEMRALLDACGSQMETHLAVAATTKYSDIREILKQFESFDYRAVIITKMDETTRAGSVISALAEQGKAISYITTGQKVPRHIAPASAVQFLTRLEGFTINRLKIEEKFPDPGNESKIIQWRT